MSNIQLSSNRVSPTKFEGGTPTSGDDVEAIIGKSKKLRIVTMAMGEMGHFFPITRVTAALEKAGHEVLAVFTNGYAEEKARNVLEHHGVKAPLICPENHPRLTLWRDLDAPDVPRDPNMDNYCDERVVAPFREKVAELKPDIIVSDFYSNFPIILADQLDIPLIVNCPAPLKLMTMGWLPGMTT